MVEWRFNDRLFPVVVAHRGASSTHPENTLESFDAALHAGALVVELDVRLTIDGVPVVMHDPDVSRTTDGSGFVHELTFAQVKALDAAHGRGTRAAVPSLAEVLELVSSRGGVDLEIKNIPAEAGYDPAGERVVEATVRLLEETGFEGPVLVSSFNPSSVGRAHELTSQVATGLLTTDAVDARDALRFAAEAGHAFVLPKLNAVLAAGAGFASEAHGAGVRVGTWTVDDPDTVRVLLDRGVDAVATNDPAMAAAVVDEHRAARS